MTFYKVYNNVIKLWGKSIDISDGVINKEDEKSEDGTIITNVDFHSKILSAKWDLVESKIKEEDTWGDLMVWTMFQVFSFTSYELFEKGVYTLVPLKVDKFEIEKQYHENLKQESWEEELALYEGIPSTKTK